MNVLMLRGLVREQRHWGDFPRALEAAWPGARTHLLDLPGAGTEHQRVSPWTIAEITRDVRERFLPIAARATGPWCLVAISLGGMLALDWCARFPEDFARVAVINTSAGNLSKPWQRFSWRNYPAIVKNAAVSDLVLRERFIIDLTINRRDLDRESLARQWADFARERPVSRRTLVRQLLAGTRSVVAGPVPRPLLVVASRGDRLVAPACSEQIARHTGGRLVMHDSGGHDLPFDDPEWLARALTGFLSSA